MKNVSTPHQSSESVQLASRHQRQHAMPRKATLAFIRQFARVYSYAPALPGQLGGLMAN